MARTYLLRSSKTCEAVDHKAEPRSSVKRTTKLSIMAISHATRVQTQCSELFPDAHVGIRISLKLLTAGHPRMRSRPPSIESRNLRAAGRMSAVGRSREILCITACVSKTTSFVVTSGSVTSRKKARGGEVIRVVLGELSVENARVDEDHTSMSCLSRTEYLSADTPGGVPRTVGIDKNSRMAFR